LLFFVKLRAVCAAAVACLSICVRVCHTPVYYYYYYYAAFNAPRVGQEDDESQAQFRVKTAERIGSRKQRRTIALR